MPKPIKKQPQPPTDINQWARHLVEQTTAESQPEPALAPKPKIRISKELRAYMSKLGKRGGDVSGARRMTSMTSEKRSEVALKAARARWAKKDTLTKNKRKLA